MTYSLLEQGIGAALAGRRDEARDLLVQLVEADERNEEAWVWLAGLLDDPHDIRVCLENALELNPSNLKAQQGLAWLEQRHGVSAPLERGSLPAPAAPVPPQPQSAEAITALLSAPAQPPHVSPPTGAVAPQSSSSAYRSLHEHPVGPLASDAPCVYCGAEMPLSQKRCPRCHVSQIVRAPADPRKGSPAMTLLSWCWLIPAVVGYAVFIIAVFIGFAEGFTRRSPGLVGIMMLVGVILIFTLIYFLLWSPFLLLARGLYRCRPWAYIIQSIWTAIELAFCVVATLVIMRMPGGIDGLLSDPAIRQRSIFLSSPAMFWGAIIISIGWRLLVCFMLWSGYGAVFGRRSRLVPNVSVSSDNYNNGLAYRKRGMWYMAVQEWEGAVIRAPRSLEYLHILGLGYAQIQQYDRARATLDSALQIAPNDSGIVGSRAMVDQMEKRGGRW
jgi:tetratricopeptide (TPR) repeat protein